MPKYPARTYEDIGKDKVGFEYLRNKLKLKHLETKKNFSQKFPHVEKFFAEHGIDLGKIREHSAKLIGASALTGTLLLAPPHQYQIFTFSPRNCGKIKDRRD